MKRWFSLRVLLPLIIAVFALFSVFASYQTVRYSILAGTVDRISKDEQSNITFLQGVISQFLRLDQQELIKQIVSSLISKPGLLSFIVVDPHGRVLASTDFRYLGEDWRSLPVRPDKAQLQRVLELRSSEVLVDQERQVLDAYSSLCVATDDGVLGAGDCGFIFYRIDLTHHYQHALNSVRHEATTQAWWTLIGALVLAVFIHWLVTRRIACLVRAIDGFSHGQRALRAHCGGRDELRWLGDNINELLDRLERDELVVLDREKRLDTLFDVIIDAIVMIDSRGRIQRVNPATERMFGYTAGEMLGKNINMLMPGKDRKQHDIYVRSYLDTGEKKIIGTGREVLGKRRDKTTFPIDLSISEMNLNGERLFVGVMRDVSERKAMERNLREANERLAISAATDGLTGLANRRRFDEALRDAINRATRDNKEMALLICDVDYFKKYNDFYGHLAGDICLQQVAKALAAQTQRAGELVARYGGEEFAVILPDMGREKAERMAEKLLQGVRTLAIPHERSAVNDVVTVSVGISVYKPGSTHPPSNEQFIDHADKGLYRAKHSGRNRYVYGEDTLSS